MRKIYWIILFAVILLQNCKKTDIVPEETGDIFKIDEVVFTTKSASDNPYVTCTSGAGAKGTFRVQTEVISGTTATFYIYNLPTAEGSIALPVGNNNTISNQSSCKIFSFILLENSAGRTYLYHSSSGVNINLSVSKGTFSMRNVRFDNLDTGKTFPVSIAGSFK
jgi:hypothetical protein